MMQSQPGLVRIARRSKKYVAFVFCAVTTASAFVFFLYLFPYLAFVSHQDLLSTKFSFLITERTIKKELEGKNEKKISLSKPGIQWNVDSAGADHCVRELSGLSKPLVTITSFGSSWLRTHKKNRNSTILETSPSSPLWIFHEDSFEQHLGRPTNFEMTWNGLSYKNVCFIDVFKVVPDLILETLKPESGMNTFLDFAKAYEPFSKPMRFKANHLLIRKIASLYFTTKVLPAGTTVIWLDSDVTFEREVDYRLRDFLQANDVSYIPVYHKMNQASSTFAQIPESNFRAGDWWVETGIFSVQVSKVMQLFFQRILELYSGDLEKIARMCIHDIENDCHNICNRSEVHKNLYMNDIFVISLLIHSVIHKHMCILKYPELQTISHGWFSAPKERCPFDSEKEKKRMLRYPHPNFCSRRWSEVRNESNNIPLVSPFPIFKYFMHHMGSTGTLREKLRASEKLDAGGVNTKVEGWLRLSKNHLSIQDSLWEKLNKLYY